MEHIIYRAGETVQCRSLAYSAVNGLKINSGRLVTSLLRQMPSSPSCVSRKKGRRGRKQLGGWSQMSLNSFIVRDTEDGKKVNSHRHIWENPAVTFCFHLLFFIQPGSRLPLVFDGFLDLCFQALFQLSGCWALRRHWRECANNSRGRSVDMCAARVLGPQRVPFAV